MLIPKLRYPNYLLLFILSCTSPCAFSYPYLSPDSLLKSLATLFVLHSTINHFDNHNTALAQAEPECQFRPSHQDYFEGTDVSLYVRAERGTRSRTFLDADKEIWFGTWNLAYDFIDRFMFKIEKDGNLQTERGYDEQKFSYSYVEDPEGVTLNILIKDLQSKEAGLYGVRFRYDTWPPVMFSCNVELKRILQGPVQSSIDVLKGDEARFQYVFRPTVKNEIPSLNSIRFGPQQKNGSIETYLYWQKDEGESTPYQNAEGQASQGLSTPRNISLDLSGLGNYTFAVTLHGVDVNDTGRYLCDIEVTRTLTTVHSLASELVVKTNLSAPDVIESPTQGVSPQTSPLSPDDTTTQKTALTMKLKLPTTKDKPLTRNKIQQDDLYPDQEESSGLDSDQFPEPDQEGLGSVTVTGMAIGIPTGVVLAVATIGVFGLVRHLRNKPYTSIPGDNFRETYELMQQ